MRSYFRSKNLLKSFYYYNLNKMKAWQSDDKERKIGFIVISIFIFIQFLLMGFAFFHAGINSLLIYLPVLALVVFLLINLIIYFLAGKYSKIYDIYRINLDDKGISFFKKNGEIKNVDLKDVSELEYKFVRKEDRIKLFSTFSNYFKLKLKNGESIVIPLDISRLDKFIEKLRERSDLKIRDDFSRREDESDQSKKEKPSRIMDKEMNPRIALIFVFALILYLLYFFLTI